MRKTSKAIFLLLLSAVFLSQASHAFEAPRRSVIIKPQLILLFPEDLFVTDNNEGRVGKEMGAGFGLKIRTHLAGPLGYTINALIADVHPDNNALGSANNVMGSAVMFTAGLCYTKTFNFGSTTLELGYGEISVASCSSALFWPSIEYSHFISDRAAITVEVAMPMVNDWFYDFSVREKFRSTIIGLGSSICF